MKKYILAPEGSWPVADVANSTAEEECCQAECCINLGTTKMLEAIDEDMARLGANIEARDAHEGGYLTNRNHYQS